MEEVASFGVPDLAGPIVAASDELIAIFVEGAVGEGQHVGLEGLEQLEVLGLLLLQLQDEFCVGLGLLSIRVLSCGFLLSVMMGSSAAISSTSSSTSVLDGGRGTLRRG